MQTPLVSWRLASLIVGDFSKPKRSVLSKMGQNLLFPPNVKGWDGEEMWINSNTVLMRFNLGMALASQRREEEFARRSTAGRAYSDTSPTANQPDP